MRREFSALLQSNHHIATATESTSPAVGELIAGHPQSVRASSSAADHAISLEARTSHFVVTCTVHRRHSFHGHVRPFSTSSQSLFTAVGHHSLFTPNCCTRQAAHLFRSYSLSPPSRLPVCLVAVSSLTMSVATAAHHTIPADNSMLATSTPPSLFSTLTTALLVLVLSYTLYKLYRIVDYVILQPYHRHRLLDQQGIHGPPFYPLIGNLLMLRDYSNRNARLQMGRDKSAMYGPLWHFMLGPFNIISMSDPDYVLAAWKTQRSLYDKGVFTKRMMGTFVGMQSLLVVDEGAHSVNRKMIAPAFHYAKLQSMVTIMVDNTEKAIAALVAKSPHIIELHDFFLRMTFDVLLACAFGTSLHILPHAAQTIHDAFFITLPAMQKRQLTLVEYVPLLRHLPILYKPEIDKGKAEIERIVIEMIQQRRSGQSHSQCDGDDLLDILLHARHPETGLGFDDDQIRSDAVTFVLAGHETSSSLMTFVIRDLTLRPQLWQQCREEVERVTGGGPLLAHHLASLTLVDACIHETFRLLPPLPANSIQAVQDHWLDPNVPGKPAIFIPKGVCLGTDIYCLHVSKELWGDTADQYDEQRWVKGSERYCKPKHAVAFNGFSVGSRNCIGSNFALMEAKVMTALLVRAVDMSMVAGEQYDVVTQKLTLEPRYGIRVRVEARAGGGKVEVEEGWSGLRQETKEG